MRLRSPNQHPDRQLDGVALDLTFTDTASGRSTARPQLEAMLAFVRDTRGTASLDPLARSIDDLRTLVPVSRPHSPARADRTSHRQVP